jgi:hypothetical protein
MAGGVDELDFGDVDALVDARAALFGGKLDWSSYDVFSPLFEQSRPSPSKAMYSLLLR